MMRSNQPKNRIFLSPLHILWGLFFLVVFTKVAPIFMFSNGAVNVRAGHTLLEKTPGLSGATNAVSAVVVYFRGLDTLGEVSVLFLVATALGMLLGKGVEGAPVETRPNTIVTHAKTLVLPHFLLTGLYITLHGHLTPGGGFQGGVMAAGASLLLILGESRIKQIKTLHFLEGLAGALYVLVGLTGVVVASSFLDNFLPLGSFGTLFSGGIIPVLYIFIGLKVGTELIAIYQHFQPEEKGEV